MAKTPRDQVNLVNWDGDWERKVLYHAACSSLLKEFPDSLDEQLFGEAGGGTTRAPRQLIVAGIMAYVKKRKEVPGLATMRLIVDKVSAGKGSEVRDAIATEWEQIMDVGQRVPYETIRAAFAEALYEHVDYQFVMQRAAARRRKEDDKMDWEEYEALIKPIQDRRDKLLMAVNIKKRLRLLKGDELDAPKVEWLVEGILPRGMFCAISGVDGIGKSLLSLEIVKAMLTNGLFLNHFMTRAGKVCLIMLDDPAALVIERLEAVGIRRHPDLRVAMELPDPEKPLESLRDLIWLHENEGYRPDLIVVDSLFNILPTTAGHDKDASALRPTMDALNEIATRTGATVLLICHDTKEGRAFAGSYVIKAAAKVTLQLVKPPPVKGKEDEYDENARVLHQVKNKLVGERHWALRNQGVGKWEMLGTQSEKQEMDARSAITAFFAGARRMYDSNTRQEIDVHGKYTEEEIVRELKMLPYLIRKALYKMKDEGKLERFHGQRTAAQRGASWYWQLPGTAPVASSRERGVAFFRSTNA